MAKTSGLGDNFYIAGYDLSGDINALSSIHGGPAVLDVTAINQSAIHRLGGLRDGGIDFTVWMNPSANQEHPALSTLPTADVLATYFRGTTVGNPAASCLAKQVNYDWTHGNDGSLSGSVSAQANGFGLEWGTMLTAGLRTDAGATTGAFFDNGAGFTFGAQAYLQVTAFSGTDMTVKIQHATTSGGAYSDLIAFSQTTAAHTTQRSSVANNTTVNEFFKVVTTTAGGFSSATFAVMIVVNPIAGQVF